MFRVVAIALQNTCEAKSTNCKRRGEGASGRRLFLQKAERAAYLPCAVYAAHLLCSCCTKGGATKNESKR